MKNWNDISTHYSINDSIKGERILSQFRKKNSEKLIRMTGNHRGTRMIISQIRVRITTKDTRRIARTIWTCIYDINDCIGGF